MKSVRVLALASTVLALCAFSVPANANSLTSPKGTTYTSTIKGESEGAVTFTSVFGGFGAISCKKSTFEGKVETHGSSVEAGGSLSSMTYSECTGGGPVTVLVKGTFRIHRIFLPKITLKIKETIIHATLFGTCVFNAENNGGTLTTTEQTGGAATIDLSATLTSPCGNATMEGAYKVVTPSTLYVDE